MMVIMKKKEIINRWKSSDFIDQVRPLLENVFSHKKLEGPADLAGIILGLDGQLPMFSKSDFQDVEIFDTNLRNARFSCAFSRGFFSSVCFSDTMFDTCRFPHANFKQCDFTNAKLNSPSLDDTVFESCKFTNTSFKGRGLREYGGRRCIFEKCNFEQSIFNNLQFRATRFVNCQFKDVAFTKCSLINVKFVGEIPSDDCFTSCELKILAAE